MFTKNDQQTYVSSLLAPVPHLRHFYTTRQLGDVQSERERNQILKEAGILPARVVWQEQIHSTGVVLVDAKQGGSVVRNADGVVWQKVPAKTLYLGVHVADCVPLLFVDPKAKIIAAVHAGWRGTLGDIAGKTVRQMEEIGAKAEDILVTLGPSIGLSCYSVDEERAHKFRTVFAGSGNVVVKEANQWFVDLVAANVYVLRKSGIKKEHIDSANLCTSCLSTEFFSYRKDTKETFGEIMGLIGFTG